MSSTIKRHMRILKAHGYELIPTSNAMRTLPDGRRVKVKYKWKDIRAGKKSYTANWLDKATGHTGWIGYEIILGHEKTKLAVVDLDHESYEHYQLVIGWFAWMGIQEDQLARVKTRKGYHIYVRFEGEPPKNKIVQNKDEESVIEFKFNAPNTIPYSRHREDSEFVYNYMDGSCTIWDTAVMSADQVRDFLQHMDDIDCSEKRTVVNYSSDSDKTSQESSVAPWRQDKVLAYYVSKIVRMAGSSHYKILKLGRVVAGYFSGGVFAKYSESSVIDKMVSAIKSRWSEDEIAEDNKIGTFMDGWKQGLNYPLYLPPLDIQNV